MEANIIQTFYWTETGIFKGEIEKPFAQDHLRSQKVGIKPRSSDPRHRNIPVLELLCHLSGSYEEIASWNQLVFVSVDQLPLSYFLKSPQIRSWRQKYLNISAILKRSLLYIIKNFAIINKVASVFQRLWILEDSRIIIKIHLQGSESFRITYIS